MNDSFISIQRVQNSVLVAGRDIDDDGGDYSDHGDGGSSSSSSSSSGGSNNIKFMVLIHCHIVCNLFRKPFGFPICHHLNAAGFVFGKCAQYELCF